MPTFTAPSVRTDLEFSLVVSDGTNDSAADTVAVAVRPPLNPTSPPCQHPAPAISVLQQFAHMGAATGTDTFISYKGTRADLTFDLWFCWPNGTREQRRTGVANTVTETVSGLFSGTTYWVAIRGCGRIVPLPGPRGMR